VPVFGPKNHGASHLISSIAALQVECRWYGHTVKEILSDAGSVENLAED